MAKGTLKFDLPEEHRDFLLAAKANDIIFGLQEIDNWMRDKIKHGEGDNSQIEEVRHRMLNVLAEAGVDLWE